MRRRLRCTAGIVGQEGQIQIFVSSSVQHAVLWMPTGMESVTTAEHPDAAKATTQLQSVEAAEQYAAL